MNTYGKLQAQLTANPKTWLVTGVAGFIGSNLLEKLLTLNQRVVGLDNFSTGYEKNLEEVRSSVTPEQWKLFVFVRGDICDLELCKKVMAWRDGSKSIGVDYVLHQAALGSVPRSIEDPINANRSNVDGFLNILVAARDAKVKSFVYAASSSTYGDHPGLPKVEDQIGKPLSPYAVTKLVNELYADVFHRAYGIDTIGLRYFNVFGKRQDPVGAYAAVIPQWIAALIRGETVYINGDGETSRDFCCVDNAVQANLLAATTENTEARNQVYNVAVGEKTSLNELYKIITKALAAHNAKTYPAPVHRDFRAGDVRHSLADIQKARKYLNYKPIHDVRDELPRCIDWYLRNMKPEGHQ